MKVYIIAEIGCNHNGDIKLAKKIVDRAVDCGVDAVKFQTFKAEQLVSKYAPKAEYQKKTTTVCESQLEMAKKLELTFDEYLELKTYCEKKGVDVFSTPFDDESLDFLIRTNMPLYKIPSGEITNLPYLEKIGQLQKKVIISTGMATLDEVRVAVNILEGQGTTDITILHCTTEYPTKYEDVNLNVLKTLKENFPQHQIGYSDHSLGFEIPIAAAALGATVIEKHFTLDQNLPGPDHKASATPDILKEIVSGIRIIEVALGSAEKTPLAVEIANKIVARKSIVAKTDIKCGDHFTIDNITIKRPGNGISPMQWHNILGKSSQKDFGADEIILDSRFENQG